MTHLARTLQALLFLSSEPVSTADLAAACEAEEADVGAALTELRAAMEGQGVVLRELAGGWALASHPDAEEAARRLLSRPRTPSLTPAQSETLAVVAYLQPVSRPEIARIRGVASDSAAATLLDRGLVEEAGRSPFGAVLYRTTELFLKQFGLRTTDDLPDPGQWDPSPEGEGALRDRLLAAGTARTGAAAPQTPADAQADAGGTGDRIADAAPGADAEPDGGPGPDGDTEPADAADADADATDEAGNADAADDDDDADDAGAANVADVAAHAAAADNPLGLRAATPLAR